MQCAATEKDGWAGACMPYGRDALHLNPVKVLSIFWLILVKNKLFYINMGFRGQGKSSIPTPCRPMRIFLSIMQKFKPCITKEEGRRTG